MTFRRPIRSDHIAEAAMATPNRIAATMPVLEHESA